MELLKYISVLASVTAPQQCMQQLADRYLNQEQILLLHPHGGHDTEGLAQLTITQNVYWTSLKFTNQIKLFERELVNEFEVPYKTKMTVIILNENLSQNETEFQNFISTMRRIPYWNARGKIIVFGANLDTTKMVLQVLWSITRAVGVVVADLETCKFYTWWPYREKECGHVVTIEELKIEDLFPKKTFNNINGCELVETKGIAMPYVWDQKLLDVSKFQLGVEEVVIKTIMESINGTMVYKVFDKPQEFWLTGPFEKPVGAIQSYLYSQVADIAYCCMALIPDFVKYGDFLYPYMEEAVVWFAPPPRVIEAGGFFAIFTIQAWGIFVGTIFAISLASYFHIENTTSIFSIVLRVFSGFLSISFNFHSRMFGLFTSLAAIHFMTAAQSGLLFMLIQEWTEKPISSVADVANSKFDIIFAMGLQTFLYATTDINYKKLLQRKHTFDPNAYEVVDKVVVNKSHALLYPKFAALYYMGVRHQNSLKVVYTKEAFFKQPVTIHMAPGHPLHSIMDFKLRSIVESGLVEFWLRNLVQEPMQDLSNPSDAQVLTISNLKSIFYLWVGGISTSLSVFVVELFQKKHRKVGGKFGSWG